jgi:hypothetical protein
LSTIIIQKKSVIIQLHAENAAENMIMIKHVTSTSKTYSSWHFLYSWRWPLSVFAVFLVAMIAWQVNRAGAASCTLNYVSGSDWHIVSTMTGCTIEAGTYTPSSFTVDASTTVYAQPNIGGGTGVVIVASGNITIAGTLNADGLGYTSDLGPGAGAGNSGAGHGGSGGYFDATAGAEYGSVTEPASLGSGSNRRAGGGAIKLQAGGTLTVSGIISANGESGTGSIPDAGAGGSVYLAGSSLAGTGTVRANGGTGTRTTYSGSGAGAGGGRIAVYYTGTGPSWTIEAKGGAGSFSGAEDGGAGTVYIKEAAQSKGNLIVGNGNNDYSAYTTQLGAAEIYNNLTIKEGADYLLGQTRSLTVVPGGTITGGGTSRPRISVSGGSSLDPGTANWVVTGLDVFQDVAANVQTVTSLTVGPNVNYTLDDQADFAEGLATLTVGAGGSGNFYRQGDGELAIPAVTVGSGGHLSHAANASTPANSLNLSAVSLDVQTGGFVEADYRGFAAGYGPGAGTGDAAAGYGGHGGTSSTGGTPGAEYGSLTEPASLGSGSSQRAGGGAVKLVVTGTMNNSGTISVNGLSGTGSIPDASSGGSIWIDVRSAASITGTGIVRANGGAGTRTTYSGAGGGGGGGRIAVHYTGTLPNWDIQAHGGDSVIEQEGGAGTIFLKETSATYGDLIVDNDGYSGAYTTQLGLTEIYDHVSVRDGADYLVSDGKILMVEPGGLAASGNPQPTLTMAGNGTFDPQQATFAVTGLDFYHLTNGNLVTVTDLTVGPDASYMLYDGAAFPATLADLTVGAGGSGNLYTVGTATWSIPNVTIGSGGHLSHEANGAIIGAILSLNAVNLDVQTGGYIETDYRGYGAGQGPGASTEESGAGHGGMGATSSDGVAGTEYGSVQTPVTAGSGSEDWGGGGVIKLVVTGTMNNSGTVSANGHSGNYVGASSGGSVWIDVSGAASVTGTGLVTANGGAGLNYGTGGAGGGRVALYYAGSLPDWTILARGGSGNYRQDGGAGTIYLKESSIGNGVLVLENGGNDASRYTTQLVDAVTYSSVQIKDGANYLLPSDRELVTLGGLSGGTSASSLTVSAGGSVDLGTGAVDNVNVINDGTVENGALTLTDGYFDNNVSLGGVTDITVGSGGTFYHASDVATLDGSTDLTVNSGGSFVQEGSGLITINSLTVGVGGSVTHADNSSSLVNKVNLSMASASVAGSITADGLGYDQATGTGAGLIAYYGTGASHCAIGGDGHDGESGSTVIYGDANDPDTMGSGGGNDAYYEADGGDGGGVITMAVSGTLTVSGSISADGVSGPTSNSYSGGGSGGSVNLTVNSLAGSGVISADGGNGAPGNWSAVHGGGGGGGGYVYVSYFNNGFTGTVQANGGLKGGGGGSLATAGGSCTPVVASQVPPPAQLDIISGGYSTGDTRLSYTTQNAIGITGIDFYPGTSLPAVLIGGCRYPTPVTTEVTCTINVGRLFSGYNDITVVTRLANGTGPVKRGRVRIAGSNTRSEVHLTSHKAGATNVGLSMNFDMVATQAAGTLTIDFPADFEVLSAPSTAAGTSACLSGFDFSERQITATKTDCSGTVQVAGVVVNNPTTPGIYKVSWSNDFGEAAIPILEDEVIDVMATVDPHIQFVVGAQLSSQDCSSATDLEANAFDYVIDFGSLNTAALSESGGATRTVPEVERLCMQGSTNATSGLAVSVRSANGSSGLVSAATSDSIPSTVTGPIAPGSPAYGVCLVSASLGSDGMAFDPVSTDPSAQGSFATHHCAAATGTVVALTGGLQSLWTTPGVTQDATAEMLVRIAASDTVPAHADYSDALTFIATGTY